MEDWDYGRAWYHGSPQKLEVLSQGSWLTQSKELAKAFSHKPTFISMPDDSRPARHNGKLPGFLYRVATDVGPDDVTELPGTDRTHWSANREFPVVLMEEVPLRQDELVTDSEARKGHEDLKRELGSESGYLSDKSRAAEGRPTELSR